MRIKQNTGFRVRVFPFYEVIVIVTRHKYKIMTLNLLTYQRNIVTT